MLKRKILSSITTFAALALALPLPAIAAPAESVSAPIYPGPDGKPHYLLGISAFGTAQDLDRLAAAASALGWPTARNLGADGRVSLVIGFPKATTEQVDAFLKRASAGEYGAFTFESTMAPAPAGAVR